MGADPRPPPTPSVVSQVLEISLQCVELSLLLQAQTSSTVQTEHFKNLNKKSEIYYISVNMYHQFQIVFRIQNFCSQRFQTIFSLHLDIQPDIEFNPLHTMYIEKIERYRYICFRARYFTVWASCYFLTGFLPERIIIFFSIYLTYLTSGGGEVTLGKPQKN